MNIITVELNETSYTRFNCFYIERFLKHHNVLHGTVGSRKGGMFHDVIVVTIDEESLFKIKLKYGTLQDAIGSYHKEMKSSCWKEYLSTLDEDSPEIQSLKHMRRYMKE